MTALLRRRGDTASRRRTTFNPLTQVTPAHGFWAESFASDPGDGSLVSQWENGNGADHLTASGSARPTMRYAVSAFNGKKAVEFDGTDDTLYVDITDIGQTFYVLVVGKWNGAIGATIQAIVGFGSTGNGLRKAATSGRLQLNAGTALQSTATGDHGTGAHVYRGKLNPSSGSLFVDGVDVSATANTGTDSLTRIRLGSSGNNTAGALFAPSQIAFAAFYTSSAVEADLATLAADLKTYYGL